jgi:hypothetical protein
VHDEDEQLEEQQTDELRTPVQANTPSDWDDKVQQSSSREQIKRRKEKQILDSEEEVECLPLLTEKIGKPCNIRNQVQRKIWTDPHCTGSKPLLIVALFRAYSAVCASGWTITAKWKATGLASALRNP